LKTSRIIDYSPKKDAFPHQTEAINFISGEKNREIALFDEQGLGKTKIVIDSMANDIRDNILDGALVICKKTLIGNWIAEVKKHSHLSVISIYGTSNERGRTATTDAHFYITSYETLTPELTRIKQLLKINRMAIILDESHRIKDSSSVAAKSAFEISSLAVKRILITGTPVANSPQDLWAQFYFLDHGRTFGNDFFTFKSELCPASPRKGLSANDMKKIEHLREKMHPVSIRRLKEDVLELPDKRYENIFVNLEGEQKEIYNRARQDLIVEIRALDGSIIDREIENVLEKILRLVQIASNPILLNPKYSGTSAKIDSLRQIISEIFERREKAIVWTCFVNNIPIIKNIFVESNPLIIYGGTPIEMRNRNVDRFQNEEKFKLLIANPSAAKEGLTLTAANNAVYYDRTFSLVDYLQSQDRIHRISQERDCNIYKIVASDTIDEYIDEILNRKSSIASFIQGDREKDHILEAFSKQDILRYLGK
jgi:SWI/SNF-related matrix-associated actin-dependent regulator 1 of chromatin subfamily A